MMPSASIEGEPRARQGPAAQWTAGIPFESQWELHALRGVFRTEGLRQDWDSYGSLPPSMKAIDVSLHLVRKIAELDLGDLPVPHVAPVPGGGIQFEWRVGDRELELEILPDGAIESLRAERGEPLDEAALGPSELHALLAWVVSTRRSG
jgi:hypothetical protein